MKPFIAADARVDDMRKEEVRIDADLFYAEPARQVRTLSQGYGTLIQRPMEWFLRDLAHLAKATHPDLMLCWLRDAISASSGAAEIQLFTGAGYWRREWTIVRAHLIALHGYRYQTWAFVLEPSPRWKLVGARHVQVLKLVGVRDDVDRNYVMVDDDEYAVDERTVR